MSNPNNPAILAASLMFLLHPAAGICGQQAQVWDGKAWKAQAALRPGDLALAKPGPQVTLSRYGGWSERKFRASGFFRVEHAPDRWWLVDPEGCAFLSVGMCSVNLSNFDPAVVSKTFANTEAWADKTGPFLKAAGFNTLGRWSSWEAFRPRSPLPYTTTLSFMAGYAKNRPGANGERGFPNQCMPVFDPEFAEFCDRLAAGLAPNKADPWLLGHFTDNELPFRPDSLTNFLALPDQDTGKKATRKWLADRGVKPEAVTPKDEEEFLTETARRYYSTVVAAIRKHDPNHLVIGSRIHGRAICPAVLRGSAPLDVVTVNYYHRWSPEPERMAAWVRDSGRPFLISEWYAMSVSPDKIPENGAGFRVRTDAERGLFYQNMTLGLLKDTGCVGWHWFKYGGDETDLHKGLVGLDFIPHEPLVDRMKEVNNQLYQLADHFLPSASGAAQTKPANASNEPKVEPPWAAGSTTLVVLPDTEVYCQKHPGSFEAQTRWIADNIHARNIAYVLHGGDIVHDDVETQWQVARRGLAMLDGKVPYALVLGNHDYSDAQRTTKANDFFHVADFKKWPTFGATKDEGRIENAFHLCRIGDRNWIILALEFGPRDAVVDWANQVLDAHPNHLGILLTHAYLFHNNARYDYNAGPQRASPHDWGNDGEQLWQKVIRKHSNMMLVISGHVASGGPGYLASPGDHGNTVHQLMVDFENLRGGGSGYLRLLEFLPDRQTVQVRGYSPLLKQSLVEPAHQFQFTLGFAQGNGGQASRLNPIGGAGSR